MLGGSTTHEGREMTVSYGIGLRCRDDEDRVAAEICEGDHSGTGLRKVLGEGLLEYVGPLVDTHVQEKPLSIALREINGDLLTCEDIDHSYWARCR